MFFYYIGIGNIHKYKTEFYRRLVKIIFYSDHFYAKWPQRYLHINYNILSYNYEALILLKPDTLNKILFDSIWIVSGCK